MLIGELAKKLALSTSRIRFYEAQGLLKPGRKLNGYREYPDKAAATLRLIGDAQRLGFTLSEIRERLLAYPHRFRRCLCRVRPLWSCAGDARYSAGSKPHDDGGSADETGHDFVQSDRRHFCMALHRHGFDADRVSAPRRFAQHQDPSIPFIRPTIGFLRYDRIAWRFSLLRCRGRDRTPVSVRRRPG